MFDPEMRILLTGVTGQVGAELAPLLGSLGTVIAPYSPAFDFRDPASVRRFVWESKPHWIVNPAAHTAVDKAENEPELAYAVNAEGPRMLGEMAVELGIPVIHFSTDYVFDGSGSKPWVETDGTGPVNVYGASKLAGEQALIATGAAHLIFRTSWIYGTRGKNFLLTILPLALKREELRIVNDQHGAPTWSRDLAHMVEHVMREIIDRSATSGASPDASVRAAGGIFHAANDGDTTWFGFAQRFLRLAAIAYRDAKIARLVPITSDEFRSPAKRPANSRLDCGRLRSIFGYTMPPWQDSVSAALSEVLRQEYAVVSSA